MRKRDLGILITCAFAVLWSFRGEQGEYYLNESWVQPIDTTLYSNLHFPSQAEKLPRPLITDIDGDGQNDVVFVTRDCTIKIADVSSSSVNTKLIPSIKAQSSLLNKIGVRTGRRPIGLASGYLRTFSDQEKPTQVIVVITDGWIVMCFSHNLELLWEHSPVDEVEEGFYHEEVAITIGPHPARVGDEGIVVAGGRLKIDEETGIDHEHNTEHIGPDERVEREGEGNHFSYYAFDGKTGNMRWKHEEGDFFTADPHDSDDESLDTILPEHSYKQHVFSQVRHLGEVDWRQYKHHILSHLPYRWVDGYSTHFMLDQFTKKTNFGRAPSPAKGTEWNTEAIGIANPLGSTTPQNQQPTPKPEVAKPNVIVATVKGGLEIIHLYTGRPLCRLLLPSLSTKTSEGSYADVNGDQVIDQVLSVISDPTQNLKCVGRALAGVPPIEQLWNGSICASSSDGSMQTLLLRNFFSQLVTNALRTISPSFLPSTLTSGMNSIFLVSSGKITSFGPNGRRMWSFETPATWTASGYASLSAIHISPTDPNLQMLVMGGSFLVLVSADGNIVFSYALRKAANAGEQEDIRPIAPPVLGDFNNDGLMDIIILGHDGFYGFSIHKGTGSVLFPTLILSLIGVMVFALVKGERSRDENNRGTLRKRALD